MSITIKDVAKQAGVSVATVSRVLNDSSAVSEETARIVNDVIEQMGYSPNLLGRNLRRRETKSILIVVPSTGSFYGGVIKGIQDEVENDYDVLIACGYSTRSTELRLLGMLANHTVDAAVLMGTRVEAKTLDALSAVYHIGLCSESVEGSNTLTVLIDNRQAAYDVITRFIANGKERIALVTTDDNIIAPSSDDRLRGYLEALADNGIEVREEYIFRKDYDFTCGIEAAKRFLSLPEPPEAVLCISDLLAAGVIKEALRQGVTVGEDLEVCGFDNVELCEMITPMITTVAQPAYQIGRTCARSLVESLRAGHTPHGTIIMDHEIIVRESAKL
ncbi:MAG: LacI family DNA-binding transcriptional regulator [Oscillospiraceae bacterium]|nr:LacI family DNA-binding transcriptional regulator [Oscillospiraceae bacterium]